jgi:hypothetical protein
LRDISKLPTRRMLLILVKQIWIPPAVYTTAVVEDILTLPLMVHSLWRVVQVVVRLRFLTICLTPLFFILASYTSTYGPIVSANHWYQSSLC